MRKKITARQKKIILGFFDNGMIQFGQFVLKSGIISPFYFDLRPMISYPTLFNLVIEEYARVASGLSFDHIVGIPYTAIPLATALGVRIRRPTAYTRKESKGYASDKFVEGNIKRGQVALLVDDLITTAKSKFEVIEGLKAEGVRVKDIVVLIDREQGGREQLASKNVTLHLVFSTTTIFEVLLKMKKINKNTFDQSIQFVKKHNVWVSAAKKNKSLFKMDRSIIVACDVANLRTLEKIIKETAKVKGIGGYKVGLTLALSYGLPGIVKTVRKYTNLPIIYDHQKAGNDIPKMGGQFAQVCKDAGVDSVIIFPFTGPVSESDWIEACFEAGLHVMVGAHMTHDGFLETEGGSIEKDAPERIFTLAAEMGVRDFVVPGNKPQEVLKYRLLLEECLGANQFRLFAPGFVGQGGSVTQTGEVAGKYWHAIVGSAIYQAENMGKAASQLAKSIV